MNLRYILVPSLSLIGLAAVACGDDETTPPTTTTTTASSGGGDTGGGGGDGGSVGGGGMGGGGAPSFETPTPFAVSLSPTGEDQLQSVTAAGEGEFLAAGFAAETVGGPRLVTVVKFTARGPVASFGTDGVATTAVEFVGGSDEIDIATQSDGKIIVSATIANNGIQGDRDIAVLRLEADGALDATFGTDGVAVIDINDAIDDNGNLLGRDGARGLAIDANDNIFIHAYARAIGQASGGGDRTDTDFTVVKLTPNGAVDDTFADSGFFRLDVNDAEANATARGIKTLADGSIIAGGYANTPDIGTTQAVLYKLTPAGDLDPAFPVFHEEVLATQTEIYNFALHGTHLVTGGYGRNAGDKNDWVSLKFDVATGERDVNWGGAANGAVVVDPSGTMLGSNCRNAIGLPDGGTILIGSTGPNNMTEQNAAFVVLDADGQLHSGYGDGIHVLPLGNDGNDQLWGGAVSGNYVALVGYQGGGQDQTDTTNDDAYGIVFEVQ